MAINIILILIAIMIFAMRLRISNNTSKIAGALKITVHLDSIQSLWE